MNQDVFVILPEPPSANRYWRFVVVRKRAVVLLSAEARAYRKTVADHWPARRAPHLGPVAVTLDWYRGRKSGDLDNRLKQVLDALKGLAYADDGQVVAITARRHDDKHVPRVEVTIAPVAA